MSRAETESDTNAESASEATDATISSSSSLLRGGLGALVVVVVTVHRWNAGTPLLLFFGGQFDVLAFAVVGVGAAGTLVGVGMLVATLFRDYDNEAQIRRHAAITTGSLPATLWGLWLFGLHTVVV